MEHGNQAPDSGDRQAFPRGAHVCEGRALPYFLPATHGTNMALAWLFLSPATRQVFSKLALWVLKVD